MRLHPTEGHRLGTACSILVRKGSPGRPLFPWEFTTSKTRWTSSFRRECPTPPAWDSHISPRDTGASRWHQLGPLPQEVRGLRHQSLPWCLHVLQAWDSPPSLRGGGMGGWGRGRHHQQTQKQHLPQDARAARGTSKKDSATESLLATVVLSLLSHQDTPGKSESTDGEETATATVHPTQSHQPYGMTPPPLTKRPWAWGNPFSSAA